MFFCGLEGMESENVEKVFVFKSFLVLINRKYTRIQWFFVKMLKKCLFLKTFWWPYTKNTHESNVFWGSDPVPSAV